MSSNSIKGALSTTHQAESRWQVDGLDAFRAAESAGRRLQTYSLVQQQKWASCPFLGSCIPRAAPLPAQPGGVLSISGDRRTRENIKSAPEPKLINCS